jgi:predicted Zn-dependent protease
MTAALPLTLVLCFGATSLLAVAPAAATLPTQSWNGYKWARTGLLEIKVGNNATSIWQPYLATAVSQWSASSVIDMVRVAGKSATAACGGVYGTVQICNSNYGANGWLGYTNVWTSGGFVVQATVRLNDYYFANGKYGATEWRSATVCHELGHTLGLDHADASRTNANTGNCLDVSNDATGRLGTNGTLANVAPIASDFTNLNAIYASLNSTQLSSTKPSGPQIGAGSFIDGFYGEGFGAVPEPDNWAMLIAGFGVVGLMQRRRRTVAA